MSNVQAAMNLEFLPNEMLIECLKYLNCVDIFYSFNQLNYRFNTLIRNIPLYLDFRNILQPIFHQLCTIILSNPEIKKQIYSLQLSNQLCYCQIYLFLRLFSLNEFPNLRSLTLVDAREENVSKLILMLPLMSQLSSFRLIDHKTVGDDILSAISISNLRTLIVPTLSLNLELKYNISSIINLTIFSCSTNELLVIFSNASRLKYLIVQKLLKYTPDTNNDEYSTAPQQAIHLKQFIINNFEGDFHDVNMLLKQTPNLCSLTINSDIIPDMAEGDKWQDLITCSLPYLKVFKFIFRSYLTYINDVRENFKQLQSDFWNKQHHWYTEYSISKDSSVIYTIPYLSNSFLLASRAKRYCDELVNNCNTFENVTGLVIDPDVITENCRFHFSHVTSLTLNRGLWGSTYNRLLDEEHIESLKMTVNLSNVKHLSISRIYEFKASSVLLEILKQTTQISSLAIDPYSLISLLDDDELCNYLTRMIKKLDINSYGYYTLEELQKMNQFWKIFSDIEQISCAIEKLNDFVFLLDHLPKLLRIDDHSTGSTLDLRFSSLVEQGRSRGVEIITDWVSNSPGRMVTIWIIRGVH